MPNMVKMYSHMYLIFHSVHTTNFLRRLGT